MALGANAKQIVCQPCARVESMDLNVLQGVKNAAGKTAKIEVLKS